MSDQVSLDNVILGDVTKVILGGTPSTDVRSFWDGGDIPWMSSGDIHQRLLTNVPGRITKLGLDSSNATLVDPPAVAIALAGQGKTRGTVAFVFSRLCTNQSVALLKPNDEVRLAPKYLFHNLDNRYEELRARSSGGGRAGLSAQIIRSVPLLLPPIEVQRRIAEILDAVDDRLLLAERTIAKLRLVKVALSRELYGSLDGSQVALATVAHVQNGSTPSRARHDYWESGTIPWLASGKVNDYLVTTPSELITQRAVSAASLKIFPRGSVIIGMIGEGKTRGMSARLELAATINQNLAGVIPGDRLESDFLHHYLVLNYKRLRAAGRGSNQDALNTKLVGEFEVPLPDLEEQRRIATQLNAIDQRLMEEERSFRKLHLIKRGLTADLLSDHVRVAEAAEP